MADDREELLRAPSNTEFPKLERVPSSYDPLYTFDLPKGNEKTYQHQYADVYFLRLAKLKPVVEQLAAEAWDDLEIAGERPRRVERVLDVRQGELCWVVGTVFMEMPLKPNILEDIAKEHWIAAPPTQEKYISPNGGDEIMLEDESGRLRLAGVFLTSQLLTTGCIIAVMGTENADGDFEVVDLRFADLPRQPERWERADASAALSGQQVDTEARPKSGKIAFVSGLGLSGEEGDSLALDMLSEYLLGESGGSAMQQQAAQISRLVIAGGALAQVSVNPETSKDELAMGSSRKVARKYGYDASAYNPAPTEALDAFLIGILPSIPVTLMPGASDPANVSIPQQPMHPALFPQARAYTAAPDEGKKDISWFHCATNPWQADVDGWRLLGNGGQPVEDICRYIAGNDRLTIMEHMLRWRHGAPTAPDTLWSYPFQTKDPLIIQDCPHIFFAGNQPHFDSSVIEGPAGQKAQLIALPKFYETGILVLFDMETFAIDCVEFEVYSKSK